jgi:hypothetical protein
MHEKIMILIWSGLTLLNLNTLLKAMSTGATDKIVFWGVITVLGIGFLFYQGFRIHQESRCPK